MFCWIWQPFRLRESWCWYPGQFKFAHRNFWQVSLVILGCFNGSAYSSKKYMLMPTELITSLKKFHFIMQAIHCRSMVPLQDTPAVKSSYSAEVSEVTDTVWVNILSSLICQSEEQTSNSVFFIISPYHQCHARRNLSWGCASKVSPFRRQSTSILWVS